ncbi:XdhC family protein [Flavobacteriaceae bacterium F08102]|nr:XdhC family protein [Flavobacteriaceae bacterium F08102]
MKLWQFIETKLSTTGAVYLMCVMQHQGSSPGRQGFKMAVATDGAIFGSIGGGVMEYNLAEQCKTLLKLKQYNSFAKRQIHKGTITHGSGMICSGEQTVLFYPILIEDLPTVKKIKESLKHGATGLLELHPNRLKFELTDVQLPPFDHAFNSETDWYFKELLNFREVVYVVGGGHVGLATSKLLVQLGYYVILYDNREDLNTFYENTFANEKKIIDYRQISKHITNPNAIIAIMTNKYTDDKIVLRECIRIPHQFLGVLGSTAKLDLMFDVLGKEGVSKEELNKIHAPIGLPIRSQTPDEIAISIAAQLISLRPLRRKMI